MKVRVIACGNPFMGNDAAGLRVMELLQREHPGVDVVEGGMGGLGLIPLMEGYDRIVIVDATQGMGPIGSVRVFRELPPSDLFPLSLHDLGIAEAVLLARTLGISPDVTVVGIEGGAVTGFRDGMDPAVEEAAAVACRQVLDCVGGTFRSSPELP
ncbi:MAG: hydrogenase maturation protease [Methanomicrobiales archaeon]|nr:hydrogenase maturation protease [Methanomicrobiales archaeon]MDI6877343.1 hydrogenase maturation protease [Methanomicrobiales archaeon]